MSKPSPAPRFEPGEMQRYRKEVHLTQEVMAERMGYGVWQYKRWERGRALISLANAEKFLAIIFEERATVVRHEEQFAEHLRMLRAAPPRHLPKAS